MTSIRSQRNPMPPPVDVDEYDWHLAEWREEPTVYSRGPDGEKVPHYFNRPLPSITVIVDYGSRMETYILTKKELA